MLTVALSESNTSTPQEVRPLSSKQKNGIVKCTEAGGDSLQGNSKLELYPFTQVPKMNQDGVLEMRKQTGMLHSNLKSRTFHQMQVKTLERKRN